MKLAVPAETGTDERRVALTPPQVAELVGQGFEVTIQSQAGARAGFHDEAYLAAGAAIASDHAQTVAAADLVVRLEPPSIDQVGDLPEGSTLISFIWPKRSPELVEALRARGVTTLAEDCVPRITTAQKLDALSSMANLSGYRAVLEAASALPSFFSLQMTAAGRINPATVLVIGAGVAGLAAIGAARGLGARVRAFDTREASRDEVKSLGADFLDLDFEEDGDGGGGYAKVMSPAFIEAEMALFREQAKEVDVVITTALVPGNKAPLLWDKGMVESMKPGSVVVDLAAHQGGNCECTVAGESVDVGGVTVIGYTDLASRMAPTASTLYGGNILHFIKELGGNDGFSIDLDNPITRGALVTHKGEVMWPAPKPEPRPAPKPAAAVAQAASATTAAAKAPAAKPKKKSGHGHGGHAAPASEPSSGWLAPLIGVILLGVWAYLRFGPWQGSSVSVEAREFVQHLTVFVLACFVGWQVVWSVTAALHTPLMSVTNAISGIIIVGGLLEGARGGSLDVAMVLGLAATLLATINIAGGFLVTHRMLRMFRR